MRRAYVHEWNYNNQWNNERHERQRDLEQQLKAEGYELIYERDRHGVEVHVKFKDSAQAAIYKLTYM
jgi:hypothetical protein